MKLLLFVIPFLALTSCANLGGSDKVRYVCQCDPGCDCDVVSDEPGKCDCGKYLIPG